jgi:hypothetical protein
MLADLVAVSGTIKKRSQYQHVERAWKKIGALWALLCHRRRSTLDSLRW